MTVNILCFILFLVGLYGLITRRNLVKIVISLSIMEFSLFIFLELVGYIDGGIAPIITGQDANAVYVDPLPQAMILTAIVIGLATTAMLMAIAIRLYRKYKTFDIREIKNLKG
ncbi:MAG: cation:proton antiporter [Bacteroidetes bacterium GWF2_33_16]|nr:MAG: cation:proton antiporter [Bacteroidetes bacterium GWE2_32_14]OFY06561.1 MAG: cation:proton antiporter [Bacteroidetes bacterium GWF2_33_16]